MQSENVINELNKSLTSESDDDNFKDFIDRIKSYVDGQKWIKKPLRLSPSICSRYGWKCIKTSLLECVTCGAKLSAPDSKIGNFESYKACLDKTMSSLKENHGKYCPWPITPSPETFVKMILMAKEEALSQFLKRVKSSLLFQSSFPVIKESVIHEMGFSEKHILSLCKMAGIRAEEASRYGKSLVPLTAAGWTIVEDEDLKKPFLKCNHCLRSIWCGWFSVLSSENSQDLKDKALTSETAGTSESASEKRDDDNSSNDKEQSEEPPAKKCKISSDLKKGDPFDPLYEHRPWCLWILDGVDNYSGETDGKEGKENIDKTSNLPGWKIFMKSLLKNVSDCQTLESNDSPSKEKIRNVKSLLEQWTNPV